MTKLYAQLNSTNDTILNISTMSIGEIINEVILDDKTLDISKLPGYKIEPIEAAYHISYDQDKYDAYLAEQKKEEAIAEGEKLLPELAKQKVLDLATDEEAYVMRYMYDLWAPKTDYVVGNRRLYGDNLYKCKQNHTSEEGPNRTPDYLPALWDLIAPEDPTLGTIDNPIPIPEPFSSMEYVKGKYYIESDVIYLMNRPGMEDGETISLTYKPSQLVGHYFEVVTKEE